MDESAGGRRAVEGRTGRGLGVRVSLGTYRIFYESGKEDFFLRVRGEGSERELRRRAVAREEERRRCRLLR